MGNVIQLASEWDQWLYRAAITPQWCRITTENSTLKICPLLTNYQNKKLITSWENNGQELRLRKPRSREVHHLQQVHSQQQLVLVQSVPHWYSFRMVDITIGLQTMNGWDKIASSKNGDIVQPDHGIVQHTNPTLCSNTAEAIQHYFQENPHLPTPLCNSKTTSAWPESPAISTHHAHSKATEPEEHMLLNINSHFYNVNSKYFFHNFSR